MIKTVSCAKVEPQRLIHRNSSQNPSGTVAESGLQMCLIDHGREKKKSVTGFTVS